jgi:hypothetical protein
MRFQATITNFSIKPFIHNLMQTFFSWQPGFVSQWLEKFDFVIFVPDSCANLPESSTTYSCENIQEFDASHQLVPPNSFTPLSSSFLGE